MSGFSWNTFFQPNSPGSNFKPYDDLATDPATIATEAATLNPPYALDPGATTSLVSVATTTGALTVPDKFYTAPGSLDPTQDFDTWSTAFQYEYLYNVINNPSQYGLTSDSPIYLGQGIIALGSGTPPQYAMISSDASGTTQPPATRVYILNNLQLSDIAQMSTTDQQRLQSSTFYTSTLKSELGLGTMSDLTGDTNTDGAYYQLSQMLTTGTTQFTALPAGVTGITVAQLNWYEGRDSAAPESTATPLSTNTIAADIAADFQVFMKEFSNLTAEVTNGGSIIVPANINAAASAILSRFTAAVVYGNVALNSANKPTQTTSSNNYLYTNIVTTSDPSFTNAPILTTYQSLMQAENQYVAADSANLYLAQHDEISGSAQHLDAPELMAAFMMNASLKLQATNAAATARFQGLNNLLGSYTEMQNLVNGVLAQFSGTNTSQTQSISNNYASGGTTLSTCDFTPAQLAAISMFDSSTQTTPLANPEETLAGVSRPPAKLTDGKVNMTAQTQSAWQAISQNLSDAVTQLNTQTQLQFNQINNNAQQLSNFQNAASSALSKAADVQQTIARNILPS